MRKSLKNPYVSLLKYGIREITLVVDKLKKLDSNFPFVGENIGDPIVKGWAPPDFMKEILKEAVTEKDITYGYSHSRGLLSVREWVVEEEKKSNPESNVTVDDVVFANGLGSAINCMLYRMLPKGVRVIGPCPAYPTHISSESFSAENEPVSYKLDPENNWQINLADLEQKIENNPDITGILVINPNNPTGGVYTEETLGKIVDLAEKYDLFIISDEIYYLMVYNGTKNVPISRLAHNRVPLLTMRGSSKDLPWPGGRCGWLEFHNRHLDFEFDEYAKAVSQGILMEVCATSLPQYVVPSIYEHPDFPAHLEANNKKLEKNVNYIAEVLNSIEGLSCNKANGAFYMMPIFSEGVLNDKQTLPIAHEGIKQFIEELVATSDMPLDKRFVYYLLGSTGICVVPATDFYSPHFGFRVTTLERDPEKLKDTYIRLKAAIEDYLSST